jgi:membrane protein insertase Oxa1/YidC/SpoIIIJ
MVDNELAPRIENTCTTAIAIHDAVVKVNSALVALNRFPGVTVPTLSNELSLVSDRAQEAQTAAQDLHVMLANIKADIVTKAESAVRQVTSRIDAPLARIQALVNIYQAKVTSTQERISSTTNTILTLLLVTTVSLTFFLIIFSAGLVLLIYVCWQYVRFRCFPSLRVMRT